MKLVSLLIIATLMLLTGMMPATAEEMEDFTFKDIHGQSHQLSDYKGKWVVVNYWGTFCPPCLEEIPDLVAFAQKHKEKAVVLGFDAGGTTVEDLKKFAADYKMDYLIAPVQESTLTAFGILQGIPTSYVLTPEGEQIAKVVGVIDMDEVETFMTQYATESEEFEETEAAENAQQTDKKASKTVNKDTQATKADTQKTVQTTLETDDVFNMDELLGL